MSKSHNFFIPDAGYLIDTSAFLSFLNTVISEFHECLFCGTTRSNRWATQDHMKSKGHCRIDIEGEWAEWADFWDFGSEDEPDAETAKVDDNELRLNPGKTVGHRSQARQFRHTNRTPLSRPSAEKITHSNRTLDSANPSKGATSTELALRAGTSTSLIGVPELQQKALRVAELRTLEVEIRAKKKYQDELDRQGNFPKFRLDIRRKQRVPNSI
jgi:pre-60S factor REI1